MKQFDVLIIGGSAAGLSCALILGSAKDKPFATNKNIGIITHQRTSALQNAVLNNVLGFEKGTKGADVLIDGLNQLKEQYPHVDQISDEKVIEIEKQADTTFIITTNKSTYQSKLIMVAVGPSKMFSIKGLVDYVEPHIQIPILKDKVMLKNNNHLVEKGIYVAGVLAGWRSQYAIAAGSGAQVGTDILTLWNNGNHTVIHEVVE